MCATCSVLLYKFLLRFNFPFLFSATNDRAASFASKIVQNAMVRPDSNLDFGFFSFRFFFFVFSLQFISFLQACSCGACVKTLPNKRDKQ